MSDKTHGEFQRYHKDHVRDLYDAFYTKKDFIRFGLADSAFVKAVLQKTGLRAGAKILDLGCGTGKYTHLFTRQGMDACGIDLSGQAIKLAQKRYPDSHFFVGDVLDLSLAPRSFDAILCSGLSLFNEPELSVLRPFVHKTAALLKDQGWFIFSKTTALTNRPSRKNTRMEHDYEIFKRFFKTIDELRIIKGIAVYPHLYILFGGRLFDMSCPVEISRALCRLTRIPLRVFLLMKKAD